MSGKARGPTVKKQRFEPPPKPTLPGPWRNQAYVDEEWSRSGGKGRPKTEWVQNPKSVLANYVSASTGKPPDYAIVEGPVEDIPMAANKTNFRSALPFIMTTPSVVVPSSSFRPFARYLFGNARRFSTPARRKR